MSTGAGEGGSPEIGGPRATTGSEDGSMGRRGWIGLALATALAFALRAWGWSTIGIDHFDEGVYAFTGLAWSDGAQPLAAYPDQILFSPPIYPFLVSLAFRLSGPSAVAAVAINVLVGVATVFLVGLLARRWFGWQAGVAAAVLLATDPLHLMLSRAALTDAVFLLFFVLALAAWVEALRARTWAWAIAAGVLTGLAWNTKYHGWFTLLIAGWGLLAVAWDSRRDREAVIRLGKLWLVMAGVAAACYLPWALHVQGEIGYGALLEYQGTNVTSRLAANVRRQLGQQAFIENQWSRLGPGIAAVSVLLLGSATFPRALLMATGIALGGALLGQGFIVFSLLVAALCFGLRPGAPTPMWLLAGLTALWMALAPAYDPYARLLLPLWTAAAVGSGWVLSRLLVTSSGRPQWQSGIPAAALPTARGMKPRSVGGLSCCLLIVTALTVMYRESSRPQSPWRSAVRMEAAAEDLTASIPEGSRVIVLAEPALAFYLHLRGRPAFERTDLPEEIAGVSDTVFVAAGHYVRTAPYLRENIIDALAARLSVVDTVAVVPRDLRLLDDLDPGAATDYLIEGSDAFDVALFLMIPSQTR